MERGRGAFGGGAMVRRKEVAVVGVAAAGVAVAAHVVMGMLRRSHSGEDWEGGGIFLRDWGFNWRSRFFGDKKKWGFGARIWGDLGGVEIVGF